MDTNRETPVKGHVIIFLAGRHLGMRTLQPSATHKGELMDSWKSTEGGGVLLRPPLLVSCFSAPQVVSPSIWTARRALAYCKCLRSNQSTDQPYGLSRYGA